MAGNVIKKFNLFTETGIDLIALHKFEIDIYN